MRASLNAKKGDFSGHRSRRWLLISGQLSEWLGIAELPSDAAEAFGFRIAITGDHLLGLLVFDSVGKAIHPRLATQSFPQVDGLERSLLVMFPKPEGARVEEVQRETELLLSGQFNGPAALQSRRSFDGTEVSRSIEHGDGSSRGW